MSWVATAVIGGAVIGGVASNRASKRAAEGQEQALGVSSAATEQARGDVTKLFGRAGKTREEGFGRTLDFLSGAPSRQIDPFQRGSLAAQETTAAGLPQIQNAILGRPVDFSQLQPKSIGAPEDFNIDISRFRSPALPPPTGAPSSNRVNAAGGPIPERGPFSDRSRRRLN